MGNPTIAYGLKKLITNFPQLQQAIRAKAEKSTVHDVDKLANRSMRDIARALSFIPGNKKIPPKSVDNIFRVFYDFPIALSSKAFFKFLDKLAQTLESNSSPAYKRDLQDLVAQVVNNLDPTVAFQVQERNIESNPLYSNSTCIVINDKLKSHISSNPKICAS